MKYYNVYMPTGEQESPKDCSIEQGAGSRAEGKFVSSIIQMIIDIFSIEYGNERTYIIGLLKSHLNDILINGDKSIIDQIENYTAQEIFNSMKWQFKEFVDLDNEKINSQYRVHAKLSSVFEKVLSEFKKLKDENKELKEKLNNKINKK